MITNRNQERSVGGGWLRLEGLINLYHKWIEEKGEKRIIWMIREERKNSVSGLSRDELSGEDN